MPTSPPARRPASPARPAPGRLGLLAALVAGVLLPACEEHTGPVGDEPVRPATPHTAHRISLLERGLAPTALGSEWRREAERALLRPVQVAAPHVEEGRFVRPRADALGYRIRVERGQRLEVRVEADLSEPAGRGELFVDVFRLREEEEGEAPPDRLLSLGDTGSVLTLEPETGRYVVRVQPSLFSEGRYRVSLRKSPALAFPVAGHDHGAIQSVFGAPREAGRREHHGVDIFAPRGTPVVAAAAGRVRRARETPRGGRVVWLRDRDRRQSLYYAHLDTQFVRRGQRVETGDTIGAVGNSGNARTTPPHLHFGIYARGEGPIDPFPFIEVLPSEIPEVVADAGLAGGRALPDRDGIPLRSRPTGDGEVVAELEEGRPFHVLAATGEWYRIRLDDGSEGYVTSVTSRPEPAAAVAADGGETGEAVSETGVGRGGS